MKLADYIFEMHLTPEQFRRMLGVNSRTTLTRYMTGRRRPTPEIMIRITRLTGGLVTADDFDDPTPPKCAEILPPWEEGGSIYRFPWTRGQRDREEQLTPEDLVVPKDLNAPSPIQRAIEVLGPRAAEHPRHGYTVDGYPVDTRGLLRLANRALAELGEPSIPYPGVRGVE